MTDLEKFIKVFQETNVAFSEVVQPKYKHLMISTSGNDDKEYNTPFVVDFVFNLDGSFLKIL